MTTLTLSQQYPGQMLPVRVIHLTQGQFTIVDPEDHEELSQWHWQAQRARRTWYAKRAEWNGRYCRTIGMHSYLTGFAETDHENRNGLDNRRVNLRDATRAQNAMNRHPGSSGMSGHRGIDWDRRIGKWRVRIMAGGTRRHIGHFADLADAIAARGEAARAYFGDFAPIEERAG